MDISFYQKRNREKSTKLNTAPQCVSKTTNQNLELEKNKQYTHFWFLALKSMMPPQSISVEDLMIGYIRYRCLKNLIKDNKSMHIDIQMNT